MPPEPAVVGRDAVADFLTRPMDWRTFPTSANGRAAAVNYLRQPGGPRYEALVVDVLRIADGGRSSRATHSSAHTTSPPSACP